MKRAAKALVVVAGAATLSGMSDQPTGDVTVTITNLRSGDGVVRACMTAERNAFPNCRKDPRSRRTVVPAGETVSLTFADVAPGNYAIALLHDENDNGKPDRALGMMPREGFGFSRDAPVRMGPPKFDDAVFAFDGSDTRLTIRMRYML